MTATTAPAVNLHEKIARIEKARKLADVLYECDIASTDAQLATDVEWAQVAGLAEVRWEAGRHTETKAETIRILREREALAVRLGK